MLTACCTAELVTVPPPRSLGNAIQEPDSFACSCNSDYSRECSGSLKPRQQCSRQPVRLNGAWFRDAL